MAFKKILKWDHFYPGYTQDDPNFDTILDFYLWSCPSPNTAIGANTFFDLGWSGGNNFKRLKNSLINVSTEQILFFTVKQDKLDDTLDECNLTDSYTFAETIVLVPKDKKEVDTLFRYIRNSLAHGSYTIEKLDSDNESYYFFENQDPSDNYAIKARMILKSSTLQTWINIVKNGPQNL